MTAAEERKALGQVVRSLRELEGLSRPELAKRAELGPDMIAKIEQGAKAPSASALRRIASALDVTPIELSDRGLAWSKLKGNPEASTALLRSVAMGSFAARAAGIPWGALGGIGALGAGALIGAAHQGGKTDRARVEAAIRTRLAEKLATADLEELIEIAQVVEAQSEQASDAEPRE